MRKIALYLMVFTIVSKAFGFFREIVLAYYYGASNISDAYLISTTIPVIVFGVIGVGISTGYIPLYNEIRHKKSESSALKFSNNLIFLMNFISSIIFILSQIYTREIVFLFASGFDKNTMDLAVKFTRITISTVYLSALIYLFTSYLQMKRKHVIIAITGIPLNLIIIVSIYLSSELGKDILPYGFVISMIIQFIIIYYYSKKEGFKLKVSLDIFNEDMKKMFYISFPVILGISMDQVNALVDRTLASQAAVGGISALTYANKLNGFIQGIFIVSIISVIFPVLSEKISKKEFDSLKNYIVDSILIIQILVVPIVFILLKYPVEIIDVLFGRGSFDTKSIQLTSEALYYYSFGILAIGIRELLSKVFISFHDSKTPMINSSIAMVINIILNFTLSKYMGIGGLALATSLSAIIAVVLMLLSLTKKIGKLNYILILNDFSKIVISSFGALMISSFFFNFLNKFYVNLISNLFFTLVFYVILYFGFILILKLDFIKRNMKLILKRKGNE